MDAVWMQAVAAALAAVATIAGVFFAARQDARATRTELQKSIENFMTPRLDAMDAHIRHLDDKLEGVSREVGGLDEKVERLGEKVGRLDERVGRLDEKVGRLDERVGRLDEKVEELAETSRSSARTSRSCAAGRKNGTGLRPEPRPSVPIAPP